MTRSLRGGSSSSGEVRQKKKEEEVESKLALGYKLAFFVLASSSLLVSS